MGMYPYLSLLWVYRDWLRGGESMGGSVLPHVLRAVGNKPTILHLQAKVRCRCILMWLFKVRWFVEA